MFEEPEIIINGVKLTMGQAMTVRVAIEGFVVDLTHSGLGDDDIGKALTDGYLVCVDGIRKAMYGK